MGLATYDTSDDIEYTSVSEAAAAGWSLTDKVM